MTSYLLAAAVLAAPPVPPAPAPVAVMKASPTAAISKPLTADEAVKIALLHNPSLVVARQAVVAARGRTVQANSFLYPTISADGSYSQTDVLGGSGRSSVGSGGTGGSSGAPTSTGGGSGAEWLGTVSLRQLAFDFDKTRAAALQASAEQRATSAQLTASESDLAFAAKQAFYALVQDEGLVQADEASLADSNDQLGLARAQEKQGLGLPVDVSRAEAVVAQAQLQLTIAQNNVSQEHIALATLMGVDPRTPFTTAGTGERDLPTEDEHALIALALQRRPEITAARAAIDASVQGERSARATDLPSFSVEAGVTALGGSFPPNNSSSTVGVSVAWTPFDSGLTAGLVETARASTVAARAQLVSAQQAAIADVSQARLNLLSARQQVVTAASGLKSAQDSLNLAEGRYRAGVGTFVDVTVAQAALETARAASVTAQSAVDLALAALKHAVAEPVR